LSVAKRGYECRILLYKVFNCILYRLHKGCQWELLAIDPDPDDPTKRNQLPRRLPPLAQMEPQRQSATGVCTKHSEYPRAVGYPSLEPRWQPCPGEALAYRGRKKAKTSNVLPITDAKGFILARTGIIAGNHNDAFELNDHLRAAFKFIKRLGISIVGSYFNADSAFDTKAARWTIPNIAENRCSRKKQTRTQTFL
jgi:hypothetical protein